jgi:hypothetical protein
LDTDEAIDHFGLAQDAERPHNRFLDADGKNGPAVRQQPRCDFAPTAQTRRLTEDDWVRLPQHNHIRCIEIFA